MVLCEMQKMQSLLRSDPPRIEYLDGRSYPKVSPKERHGVVQLAIGAVLRAQAEGRGIAGTEVRHYPGDAGYKGTSLVPDVSFIYKERLEALPPGEQRQKPPFSPDIAIEIRSPLDDLRFLELKIARYSETGSILVLDVDPETRTIVAHSGDGVKTYTDAMRFEHPTVPWFRFAVSEIFAELDTFGL